jgi:ribosomal protein L37E
MTDNLIICNKCGGNAAYMQEVTPEVKTYFCFGCGFSSNTLMRDGEEFYEQQMAILPELYKDLVFTDEEGKNWTPSVTNVPDKGMVFVNGTNTNNWEWVGVKAVVVKEEEKHKYPIPGKKNEYYEFRMDMSTMKKFGQNEFMDALTYVGLLPE